MNLGTARWLLVTIFMLVAAVGCSPSPAAPPPLSTSEPTPASKQPLDYVALEAEIEKAITTGPATLDNVRAVLVSVDGETKIAHYRHGFTEDDHGHVWSVTKSVVSILIGIAIADGLIASIDQPLAELLPEHRQAMSDDTANVTLRQLMTMSGGFDDYLPDGSQWEKSAEPGGDYVDLLLARPQYSPGTAFWYSNPSAHLAAAVLAAALERADGDRPRTILDYAREKLFDPLGISTRPAFSRPLPDLFAPEFAKAGFGWGTDPNGIQHRRVRSAADGAGHDQDRGALPTRRSLERPADRAGRLDPTIHRTIDTQRRLRPALVDPGEPDGPGYAALGRGGQHIIVLPKSRAVIVYLSDMQPDSEITAEDVEPLNNVFVAAFP